MSWRGCSTDKGERPLFLTTRAWPLEGGRERWMSEVRRELTRVREGDLEMVA